MFNAPPAHHQEHYSNHPLITSSQRQHRHYHDSLPLDIILYIFSFMRLIDLCRLLQQANNPNNNNNDDNSVSDCCSYAVLSRAKAERWQLAVYTPASYMVALCQGDPEGRLALARLSCAGFDAKEGVLRFETTSSEPVLLHDLPSCVKLVCTQWPCRPAEDCATINLPLCSSNGNSSSNQDLVVCHQATNLSSDAKLSCRMMTATDHHDDDDGVVCHACNHHARHHHQTTKMHKVWFDKALVTFQWLQQGLLQGL